MRLRCEIGRSIWLMCCVDRVVAGRKLVALHGATDFAGGIRKPPNCMGPATYLMQIDRARNPSACSMVLHDVLPYLFEW